MTFEEFLQIAVPRIGPQAAFDMSKEGRFEVLKNMLISKGIMTEAEYVKAIEEKMNLDAQLILKMINAPGSPFTQPKQDSR